MKRVLAAGLGVALCVASPACAPPDLPACDGKAVDIFSVTTNEQGATVVVSASSDSGRAVVDLEDEEGESRITVKFDVVDGAPPLLPASGPVDLHEGFQNCSGEGCGAAFWSIDGFFEVGTVNFLDDEERRHGPDVDDQLSVVFPVEGGCDDDDDDDTLAAGLGVATDDGLVTLLPGERQRVTIDGAPWQAIAGVAHRSSFTQDFGPCGDCPAPGVHTHTLAEGVLYRIDD